MEATENTAAAYQEWEVLAVRDTGGSVRRLHGTQGRSFGSVKAVFSPLKSDGSLCGGDCKDCVLWCAANRWFSCRFTTACTRPYKVFGIMCVGCKHGKNPLLEGVGPEPVAGRVGLIWWLKSLIKLPGRGGVAPVETLLQCHKDRRWAGLGSWWSRHPTCGGWLF